MAYFKVLSLDIAGVMEGDHEESKSVGSVIGWDSNWGLHKYVPAYLVME